MWPLHLLRRRGTTDADLAMSALRAQEGGAGFEEDLDCVAERAHVRRLLDHAKQHGRTSASAAAAGDGPHAAPRSGLTTRPGSDGEVATVLISGLRKVYPARGKAPPKVALADLSLAIPPTECFGFLGVNGAGKTTTLSILTGDVLPSAGDGFIDGFDIVSEQRSVRSRVGYCPQFDPLLELMTGRETLVMFARLRNVPKEDIPTLVTSPLS